MISVPMFTLRPSREWQIEECWMTIFPRRAGGCGGALLAAINPPNDFWGEIVWREISPWGDIAWGEIAWGDITWERFSGEIFRF